MKTNQTHRKQVNGVGKMTGRSKGPMVYNEHVDRKVTPKMNDSINNNRAK